MTHPDRRALLGGALAASFVAPARAAASAAASGGAITLRIANGGPGSPISPYVYGSNEVGTLDGGPPSGLLDRAARVTARRFGGNLATTYNWTRNVSNAGKDYRHVNGEFLASLVGVPPERRGEPGAAVEHFHRASLDMGAISLVTLPLAGHVAADGAGEVSVADAAPSRRFVPVRWASAARAGDPVDFGVADIPHLLRRLQARFGSAAAPTGIRAYGLDNEPGLWTETHPRIMPRPARIADLLARSIAAAAAIKAIDPAAAVIGPASWGATEMATFQNAPDWDRYRGYGSFLGAYLAAFREASERAGHRLLDALDVHWYPFSTHGTLFRSEDPALARYALAAPRTLSEPGFREESWVASALPVSDRGGLSLPLLPSLERLAAEWFPGTRIAVTEFNYGGAGQVASGLALADALGRFGRSGVWLATHWGSLGGWLGQAYRLYRDHDGQGGTFGDRSLAVEVSRPELVSGFASTSSAAPGRLHVVAINTSTAEQAVELVAEAPIRSGPVAAFGFDARRATTGPTGESGAVRDGIVRVVLPPRSARHYVVEAGGRLSARP